MKDISLSAYADLADQMASDFLHVKFVPNKLIYKIASHENPSVEHGARMAAFESYGPGFKKVAFDTRRIDQGHQRNPRSNLQYFSRSQQFIDEEDQGKMETFAKLLLPLETIKKKYGSQPEYFNSYARILHESVERILRIKEADLDIFRPQLNYLEQLVFARYRLSLEDISNKKEAELQEIILNKDENLLKRGTYLNISKSSDEESKGLAKDGNGKIEGSFVQALFGDHVRRAGEEYTITITIKDSQVI